MKRFAMTTAMTGLLILLAIAAPAAAAEPQPKASEDDAAQLKAALDERVKVLTELVDELTAQYRVGTVDVAQVFSAENDLVATVTARFCRPRSLSIFTLIIAFVAIM